MRRRLLEANKETFKRTMDKFIKHLSNKYIAFGFIAVILLGSYYIQPDLWKYIFSALVTYLAATLVMRYSLHTGMFKKKRLGTLEVPKGHAFLALVFLIILATLFSDWLGGYIAGLIALDPSYKLPIVIIQTIIILALLLIDMEFEI